MLCIATLSLAAGNGCSSPAEELADNRQAAYRMYDEALKAFTSRDYAAAETQFTGLLKLKGVTPDLYFDATLRRAVCWGAAGKFDAALADLKGLEEGGGIPELIYAARSYVLRKQGKTAESRAALAKARRFNSTVQEFKD